MCVAGIFSVCNVEDVTPAGSRADTATDGGWEVRETEVGEEEKEMPEVGQWALVECPDNPWGVFV